MATVTDLQTLIDDWTTALLTDAASPKANYSIDGQSVSNNEWRKSLQDSIDWARKQIQMQSPYIINSAKRMI